MLLDFPPAFQAVSVCFGFSLRGSPSHDRLFFFDPDSSLTRNALPPSAIAPQQCWLEAERGGGDPRSLFLPRVVEHGLQLSDRDDDFLLPPPLAGADIRCLFSRGSNASGEEPRP